MGKWKTRYKFTNKRKVFKTSYVTCFVVNILWLLNLWRVHYPDHPSVAFETHCILKIYLTTGQKSIFNILLTR